MKIQKQTLHYCLTQAKEQYKLGNKKEARDYADYGIAFVATKKGDGYSGEDLIEDVKVNLWLERFWMFLENKGLLL